VPLAGAPRPRAGATVHSVPTVSAFWGDRPEDQERVAERLARCLQRLGEIDPVLSGWRPKGGSRKSATANPILSLDAAALLGRLRAQHGDFSREPMPELGFSFAAWNGGHAGGESAFSCTAGLQAGSPHLTNRAVVTLPNCWAQSRDKVHRVAEVLRKVWEPDEIVCFGPDGERTPL
jgi:hypothetical protein